MYKVEIKKSFEKKLLKLPERVQHLLHKWVACWYWEKKSIVIEVNYVGSRENAPY
jgi:hypothetical protein